MWLSPGTVRDNLFRCAALVHGGFFLVIIGVAVVQGTSSSLHFLLIPAADTGFLAIIVLRICYVYSKSFYVRILLIVSLVGTTTATLVIFFVTIWRNIDPHLFYLPPGITIPGCKAPPSQQVWKLFVPNLAFHTILYLATTIPALRMRRMGKQSQLMRRLVIE